MISATLKSPLKMKIFRGSGGTQTQDLRVTSPQLYHLSYHVTDAACKTVRPFCVNCYGVRTRVVLEQYAWRKCEYGE